MFLADAFFPSFRLRLGVLIFAGILAQSASGGEVRLKNGTVLTGKIWLQGKLSDPPTAFGKLLTPKDADPNPQNIILVDNGWQKYYVPRSQVANIDKDNVPARSQAFDFKLLKKNQSHVIASVGSIVDITPFNEFGQRTITLASQKGKLDVIQAISRIEPDHVVVESLNYNWQLGLSLKSIPFETLEKMLKQHVKPDDPVSRFALVRFYNQAEMYQQAFNELESNVRKFPDPDQQARANAIRSELMDYFGREVLRELARRKAAGQHQFAYQYAMKLNTQELSGSVKDDVRRFLQEYDDAIKTITRIKNSLVELQAKLKQPELVTRLQPFRAEINEQLNIETLPRLDAFVKSETDDQLTVEQRLALAYSGWVVSAANAITSLDLAIRYWDARFTILETVRAESVQDRDRHNKDLRRIEGVGPKVVLQLAAHLPPILDAAGVNPGEVHRVRVTPEGHSPSIAYSVLLPLDYTPYHSYPLLIALRSRDRTNDETLRWWGGNAEQPGPAMRRGYIVIAPEYAEERQSEYTYGIAAHNAVLESLRDARKRFNIDSNRVFLAGHGMGADAAFDLGMSHPDEFAGVVPMGGECAQYPRYTYMNGRNTAWYVIGRGYSPELRDAASPLIQRENSNNVVFDEIYQRGAQFDFILVEFLGRGLDRSMDEVPKVFDWMDLQRRRPVPKKLELLSLRKTDNRLYWVTAMDLTWTAVLPLPAGVAKSPKPMSVTAAVSMGNENKNIIRLGSPSKRHVIRFLPETIDFEKRVEVILSGRREFFDFVTPDSTAIVDELRMTGDRTRLPLATIEF